MSSRPTYILIQSGEIIRSLNSTSIAVLLFAIDDRIKYQNEMAEKLGCTPTPITNALQSLEELPISLVEKQREYEITPAGESVVGLLDEHVLRLGMDLCDIDWHSDEEKEQLNSLLKPLHNSRSIRPFFVLDSIYDSGGETTIDNVVDEVKNRRKDQNEVISRRQITRIIKRFEKNRVVDLEDKKITLTKHGEKQAQMLREFMDFCERQGSDRTTSSDESKNESITENETFIPAYRPNDVETSDHTIPLPPTITVDELYQYVREIHRRCDGDEELGLAWMKEEQRSVTM